MNLVSYHRKPNNQGWDIPNIKKGSYLNSLSEFGYGSFSIYEYNQ